MTKLTLDDFIKDPTKAMRQGYYPDFMSCMALEASYLKMKHLIDIKDEFFWVLNQEAYLFPIYLLRLLLFVILVITTPILFPVTAIIYWSRSKGAYRRYHEKMKNKPQLMIDGVE